MIHNVVVNFFLLVPAGSQLMCPLTAITPTRFFGSGYPAFLVSLFFIGLLTAIVEQIASLLGCVWGIKQAVSGITLVALGTSLPDTFASRSAAIHDDSADAAIGNVTGKHV